MMDSDSDILSESVQNDITIDFDEDQDIRTPSSLIPTTANHPKPCM